MCSSFVRKEANRFNWLIKGKLIDKSWSDEMVEKTYNSYMARLWGNNERAVYGEVGFESAWKAREAEMLDDELKGVCVLGYN
jgi:hypothetical protein